MCTCVSLIEITSYHFTDIYTKGQWFIHNNANLYAFPSDIIHACPICMRSLAIDREKWQQTITKT